MNKLLIGLADKTPQLLQTKRPFLVLTDDPAPFLEHFPRATVFDPHKHSFDPLRGIDYKGAADLIELLRVVFPGGLTTLTREEADTILLEALLSKPQSLDGLVRPTEEPGSKKAHRMIQRLLLSPVLRRVMCGAPNFTFERKTIIAHLDRAELGDFDALVLGTLLIGQYKGQVVVLDGGFYVREFCTILIKQKRLILGVNSLSELSQGMQQNVLLIKDKQGDGCTWEDAEVLAKYAGLRPDRVGYNEFVERAMSA